MDYNIELPFSETFFAENNILYVEDSSEDELRKALELMASYFKKEFKYDYLQYCATDINENCIGFLFVEKAMDLVEHEHHHPYRVIGGGCFRMKHTNKYILDWIWFHPFARNRGLLKKYWPEFKNEFGNFGFTTPLSAHMEQFVQKYPTGENSKKY